MFYRLKQVLNNYVSVFEFMRNQSAITLRFRAMLEVIILVLISGIGFTESVKHILTEEFDSGSD